MSTPGIVLLCLLGVAVLLLLAVSVGILIYACSRNDKVQRDLEAALSRSSFRAHKTAILAARDWLDAQRPTEVTAQSADGLRLVGEYIPCENARATLLLFHGWRSAPVVDFGCAAPFYQSLGLNLLLVHQRAQGKSEGKHMTFGIREREDVHRWVAWHNERFGSELPLILGGLSMGAATVLMACGEAFPENVKGVIADCGFTSPYEIIKKVMHDAHVPAALFLPVLGALTRCFAGFGLKEYSTLDAMRRTTLPIFFAHGEKDTFVPCEATKAAYAACASADKTLLLVPEAGHGQSYLEETERYQQGICAFVDRVLRTER